MSSLHRLRSRSLSVSIGLAYRMLTRSSVIVDERIPSMREDGDKDCLYSVVSGSISGSWLIRVEGIEG